MTDDRHEVVLALLEERPYRLSELARLFQVSRNDLRADLRVMVDVGLVTRDYDGRWMLGANPARIAFQPPVPAVLPVRPPQQNNAGTDRPTARVVGTPARPGPKVTLVEVGDVRQLEAWYAAEDAVLPRPTAIQTIKRTHTVDGVEFDVVWDGT